MEPQVEARQSKVTARWTFLSLHLYLRFCKLKSGAIKKHNEVSSVVLCNVAVYVYLLIDISCTQMFGMMAFPFLELLGFSMVLICD